MRLKTKEMIDKAVGDWVEKYRTESDTFATAVFGSTPWEPGTWTNVSASVGSTGSVLLQNVHSRYVTAQEWFGYTASVATNVGTLEPDGSPRENPLIIDFKTAELIENEERNIRRARVVLTDSMQVFLSGGDMLSIEQKRNFGRIIMSGSGIEWTTMENLLQYVLHNRPAVKLLLNPDWEKRIVKS